MRTTGDGLDALLTLLENMARPQAPKMAPSAQSDPAAAASELPAQSNGSRSVDDWWRAIDSDEHFQSLWERSQEWNED